MSEIGTCRSLSTNDCRHAIIHVMGPQSGMPSESIIDYKARDVSERGAPFTLWAQHSYRAKPEHVRYLCGLGPVELFLIASPSSKAPYYRQTGTQTTATHVKATHYRVDDQASWQPIDDLNIGPVLDNPTVLKSGRGYALVLGEIKWIAPPSPISLREWADIGLGSAAPVCFRQGAHVVCAERRDISRLPQMKSWNRVIIARAKLKSPYAVWLRAVAV